MSLLQTGSYGYTYEWGYAHEEDIKGPRGLTRPSRRTYTTTMRVLGPVRPHYLAGGRDEIIWEGGEGERNINSVTMKALK